MQYKKKDKKYLKLHSETLLPSRKAILHAAINVFSRQYNRYNTFYSHRHHSTIFNHYSPVEAAKSAKSCKNSEMKFNLTLHDI